jgi:hypothetical protein
VNELRKKNREDQKRIRELEAKLQQTQPQQAVPRLGPKPTLEGMDYDSAKYEAALEQWYGQKRQVDEFQTKVKAGRAATDAGMAIQAGGIRHRQTVTEGPRLRRRGSYCAGGAEHRPAGRAAARRGQPAMVVYALGKNPKKAKELASITDPVKFAFAVAKLEAPVESRTPQNPAPPRRRNPQHRTISGTVDSNLDRLRSEAERTGDYSKVYRYKQQLKAKAR